MLDTKNFTPRQLAAFTALILSIPISLGILLLQRSWIVALVVRVSVVHDDASCSTLNLARSNSLDRHPFLPRDREHHRRILSVRSAEFVETYQVQLPVRRVRLGRVAF